MSGPKPDAITASCYECGEETQWSPARKQDYWGFACTACGTFQQGGMFDVDEVWWEHREGELRKKE